MLNDKQKEFCRLIVSGVLANEAYQRAFDNPNKNSASVGATKLQRQAKIQAEIKRLQEENAEIVKAAATKAIQDDTTRDIMQRAERMGILTQIARGNIKLGKPMVVDKVIQVIEVVPDYMDRKNAIAELNKMDGNYAAAKADITTTNTTPQATTAVVLNFDGNKIEILK